MSVCKSVTPVCATKQEFNLMSLSALCLCMKIRKSLLVCQLYSSNQERVTVSHFRRCHFFPFMLHACTQRCEKLVKYYSRQTAGIMQTDQKEKSQNPNTHTYIISGWLNLISNPMTTLPPANCFTKLQLVVILYSILLSLYLCSKQH